MSPLLVVCLSVGTPLGGLGLYALQARLERWDQRTQKINVVALLRKPEFARRRAIAAVGSQRPQSRAVVACCSLLVSNTLADSQ
jgi:hypothetical protein